MFRTLSARLSVSLLILIVLTAVFTSAVLFRTQRLYLAEVQQKVNRDVARNIVNERLLFREGGRVDTDSLDHVFHMLMVVNPSIEVYLLDERGKVLAFSAPEERVVAERVPLEPIRRFLSGDAELPILGPDPRHPGSREPFSAARITGPDGSAGYLYVIVGSEPYRGVAEMIRSSYAFRLGAVNLVIGLLAAAVVGVVFFRWQKWRLGRLRRAVDEFCDKGFREVVPVVTDARGNDDIDRLERSIEHMMLHLVDQLERLERADRERRDLVAGISHDLRTPLASLQGYLETMKLKRRKLSSDERERHLNVALRQAERLSTLISDLFELSRLDSGHMEMYPEAFPLAELVQDVVQKFAPTAHAKDQELSLSIPDAPTTVHADIGLMERALSNVIDNAIKYTEPGGRVRIGISVENSHLRLSVADEGPGIPQEHLSRIFEPFYRTPAARRSDSDGSGLGLTIAQSILHLHGAGMKVDSRPGEGTEFRFELPIDAASTAP